MAHYNLFLGGIKLGATAFDKLSKKMDNNTKRAAQVAFELLQVKYPGLTFQKKLNKSQIPGGIGSCAPDGGVWFYNGEVIAVFEGKKQNDKGNAIERWYKNHFIIRAISPTATYVTFASGVGVIVGNPIHRILHIAHQGAYGTIGTVKPQCNNLHCNVDGYGVEEIVDIIVQTIDASISA